MAPLLMVPKRPASATDTLGFIQVVDTSKQLNLGVTGSAMRGGLVKIFNNVVAAIEAFWKLLIRFLTSPMRIGSRRDSEPEESNTTSSLQACTQFTSCICSTAVLLVEFRATGFKPC